MMIGRSAMGLGATRMGLVLDPPPQELSRIGAGWMTVAPPPHELSKPPVPRFMLLLPVEIHVPVCGFHLYVLHVT